MILSVIDKNSLLWKSGGGLWDLWESTSPLKYLNWKKYKTNPFDAHERITGSLDVNDNFLFYPWNICIELQKFDFYVSTLCKINKAIGKY
jgi:hypothetical protein